MGFHGTGRGHCKYNNIKGTGVISGHHHVPKHKSNALKKAILTGPVSVVVGSHSIAFMFYASGVVTSSTCEKKNNHSVMAVGYGTENGLEYFLV